MGGSFLSYIPLPPWGAGGLGAGSPETFAPLGGWGLGWLITDDAVALKHVGLKPRLKIPVWNGPLECRFVLFNIFAGTMKEQKAREAAANLNE